MTTPSRRRTRSAACPTPASPHPIRWDEVDDADPHDFTIFTVPERFKRVGDLHEDIDDHVWDIAPLLEWADRDEAEGKETPEEPEEEP